MKKLIIALFPFFILACTTEVTHQAPKYAWEHYARHIVKVYYQDAFSNPDPPFTKIGENTWKGIIRETKDDHLSENDYGYAKEVKAEVELILILGPEDSKTKYVSGSIIEDNYETRIATPDPGIRDDSGTIHIDIDVDNVLQKGMTVTLVKNGPILIDGL